MFGGKNEDGQIIGNLRILKPGIKPLQWIHPETKGKIPDGRYETSLTFIRTLNSLFLFGGRNDTQSPFFFNDGHLLNLDNLSWVTCRFLTMSPLPMASHCAFNQGSQIYLVSGINSKGYLSLDLTLIEFDPFIIREKADYATRLESLNSISEEPFPKIIIPPFQDTPKDRSPKSTNKNPTKETTSSQKKEKAASPKLELNLVPNSLGFSHLVEEGKFISLTPMPTKEMTEERLNWTKQVKRITEKLL
jgi:Galactose oxidase, central domain